MDVPFVVDSSAYIPFANGRGEDYLKTNTKKIKAAMPSNTSSFFYLFIYLFILCGATSVNNQHFTFNFDELDASLIQPCPV